FTSLSFGLAHHAALRCILDFRSRPRRLSRPNGTGRRFLGCGKPWSLMDRQPIRTYIEFEKPIAELESKVAELKALSTGDNAVSLSEEISKLEQKAQQILAETYAKLTPWQKTQVARHPERPHTLDFVNALVEEFTPLAGDRYFAEDQAIVGGLGRFRGRSVMVIGHEKGSDTES